MLKRVENKNVFYSLDKTSEDAFEFAKNNAINIHVNHSNVSKEFIKNMHLFGLKISTGVVNDKDIAEKLIRHDVDYVFTDILE